MAKQATKTLNRIFSILLLAVLMFMLNYLSYHHNFRINMSFSDYFKISETTKTLLHKLDKHLHIIVFVSPSHSLYSDISSLCREYENESVCVTVDYVDPYRDFSQTKNIAIKYNVEKPNVIVFDLAGTAKIVPAKQLAEFADNGISNEDGSMVEIFKAEQVFSSIIQSLIQMPKPRVCFLSGHGEKSINNYDQYVGYSVIARKLHRENIIVEELDTTNIKRIPQKYNAVVIAGPTRKYAKTEIDMINDYLQNAGRALFLLDPGMSTGFEPVLKEWGIHLEDDRVIDPTSWTGREVIVSEYGEHAITEHLNNIITIFNLPRSVLPTASLTSTNPPADKPYVRVLAESSEQSWLEVPPFENPAVYEAGRDTLGPIPIAVAVQKGQLDEMDVELSPARLVVVGDSSLVANGAIALGYNPDFIINSINWLLDRNILLNISPKEKSFLKVSMPTTQQRFFYLLILIAVPGIFILTGLCVWIVRRK
jgi:ABC-2 type transport system permease protein